jgi:hypothetical protein
MFEPTTERRELLDRIFDAFAQGDCARGEHLLARALDEGFPWDRVTAAAARGTAQRFEAADTGLAVA